MPWFNRPDRFQPATHSNPSAITGFVRLARPARLMAIAATGLVLAACGDPHHRHHDRTGSDTVTRPPSGTTTCRYELSGELNTASRLENTRDDCDYRLTGTVTVRNDLFIDAGVTIHAEADAALIVDGGRIQATGSAQYPITFTSLPGSDSAWGGIRIDSGQRSELNYVDLFNASGTCAEANCSRGALWVNNAVLSMRYSSIQNSTDHGLVMGDNSRLEQFTHNRFENNGGAPVVLPGHLVNSLDNTSRFGGSGRANTQQEIVVTPGEQTVNLVVQWKKLDVPYRIESVHRVSDGTLLIDPGVTVLFSRNALLEIQDNGAIETDGRAGQLVEFRGVRNEPGYWGGLQFTNSPWRENILRFTDLLNTGADTGNGATAIYLDNSAVALRNSLVSNNAGQAIRCDAPADDETASVASIDADSLLTGGIGDTCQVLD